MKGKQRVIIKENDKVIFDYWIDAEIIENNEIIELKFNEPIDCRQNQTLTLGEFKQLEEEVMKLPEEKRPILGQAAFNIKNVIGNYERLD